jgi:hypothetical protein
MESLAINDYLFLAFKIKLISKSSLIKTMNNNIFYSLDIKNESIIYI